MKKKFYQKKWFIVLMVILVIGIIGNALSGNEKETETPSVTDTKQIQPNNEEPEQSADNISATEDLPKPRENSIGTSDKKINDIVESLDVSTVDNDVTGSWRIVTIAEDIDIAEYALSYYHTYFTDDKEIHGIINFNNNTTGKISVMGNILNVTIYEYMDKEESDAALLYSGRLLKEFFVYMDNGDIEEIQ